jgi:transposase
VGDLDGAILWPVDLEGEAGGSELDEPKPEVPGKAVCVVGLKVTDPAIVVLELALEEKVRLRGRRRIVVGGRVLVLERHLKVEIVEVETYRALSLDRCDYHPCSSLRGRGKGGTARNALGRSRGGFSTKINADGLSIGIEITPGQAHDVTAYPALMDDIDCDPEQMLGDKGYDSEAVRRDMERRGGEAMIPSLASRKIQHAVDKAAYALRNRIERFFNRAKNSRRVATRYDKLMESFAAFILLTCIRIWIRFVHAPQSVIFF